MLNPYNSIENIENPTQLPRLTEIITLDQIAPNIFNIQMAIALSNVIPGQFTMIGIPGFDEKPFSISHTDPLEIKVNAKGPFTQLITSGLIQKVWVRGPFGSGFTIPQPDTNSAFIITTLGGYSAMGLLYQRSNQDRIKIFLTPDIEKINKARLFTSYHLLNTEVFDPHDWLHDCENLYTDFYISTAHSPQARNIQILKNNGYIACAIGICGRCVNADGQLICSDGPVFK